MPNIDGYSFVKIIRVEDKTIPIIMLTALKSEEDELSVFDKILKPYVRANLDNRIKGEGLGLFICSRICTLNGFKLEVFVRDGNFISQVIFKNSEESRGYVIIVF